jgi:hypothetical protein
LGTATDDRRRFLKDLQAGLNIKTATEGRPRVWRTLTTDLGNRRSIQLSYGSW